ncbi:DUF1800 domain-containing protein [Winogradskyella alexanderae]|uniref:DUF1800 domain-containing protein n=1 Tax=Winogradskyella alexanderae TaxID=2877123 RepID=A0ABS7XM96_9FLAO|nr:DUF1800 domain-containing protein [Winogradskyella alexanderae]MCA0131117.1 DUF1800 domain-containing protein [Winogradskyella alexanderae]
MEQKHILHLYWRAGFGLKPKELIDLSKYSREQIVDDLFEKSKDIVPLEKDLSYFDYYTSKDVRNDKKKRQELNQKDRENTKILNTIWLKRIATTKRVLRERMTLFWANHFVCKDTPTRHVLAYNTILRTHALGNFREFVKAISKEPSMIRFLNLSQNRKNSPNENFSRELLELFTLGEGNYSEKDIKECARAFTGYHYNFEGGFRFIQLWHDYNEKTFLGKSGNFDGDDIIDIILEQKQCARYICEKVYSYFVNEELDEDNVRKMTDIFYQDYNIEGLMRFVFMSDWFYEKKNIGTKIKSPVDLIVGIQRIVPVYFTKNNELFRLQSLLDQYLLFPPNVAGWKGGKNWITTNSLMLRIKLPSMLLEKESYSYQYKGNLKNLKVVTVKNKYQEKLTVYVDWKTYKENVKKLSLKVLTNTLVLCDINGGTKQYISSFGKRPSKKNLVKLMSLPEYQMC